MGVEVLFSDILSAMLNVDHKSRAALRDIGNVIQVYYTCVVVEAQPRSKMAIPIQSPRDCAP